MIGPAARPVREVANRLALPLLPTGLLPQRVEHGENVPLPLGGQAEQHDGRKFDVSPTV